MSPIRVRENNATNDPIDTSFDPMPLVVAYVRTFPSDRHKREMLRNYFWVRDMRAAGATVTNYPLLSSRRVLSSMFVHKDNSKGKPQVYFASGIANTAYTRRFLRNENSLFRDLLRFPFDDSYKMLPMKMKYILHHYVDTLLYLVALSGSLEVNSFFLLLLPRHWSRNTETTRSTC